MCLTKVTSTKKKTGSFTGWKCFQIMDEGVFMGVYSMTTDDFRRFGENIQYLNYPKEEKGIYRYLHDSQSGSPYRAGFHIFKEKFVAERFKFWLWSEFKYHVTVKQVKFTTKLAEGIEVGNTVYVSEDMTICA